MKIRQIPSLLAGAMLPFLLYAGGHLRLALHSDPKSFHPLLVEEDAGDTVRYLTTGVLLRINRITQRPEPEHAASWKVSRDGRSVDFQLRQGICFSDGSPFDSADVAHTLRLLADPNLKSPVADLFRGEGGLPIGEPQGPWRVVIRWKSPVAGVERLIDQLPILSSRSPLAEKAGLGPFVVGPYKAGSSLILQRNPNYWKRDGAGRQLPYLDEIRFDIQANADIEALRFRRGELHLIQGLAPEAFEQLRTASGLSALDAGPSFDSEMLWFNQTARAPIPAHKRAWFRSQGFRKAISLAINRADIARLVYRGHATPIGGPYSPANKRWYNPAVQADPFAPERALQLLSNSGFSRKGDVLYDREGNKVEFSVVTNSGNAARIRIATLLQQDLAAIGIKLTLAPLDFPSLIERITKTYAYEACLLGLVGVDPDPNGLMNVLLSSGANHQWNPRQSKAETPWEAEIDRLMRAQSASLAYPARRDAFFRVLEILAQQQPFIYLVSRNSLVAVSKTLYGVKPSALRPQLLWNAESLSLKVENTN